MIDRQVDMLHLLDGHLATRLLDKNHSLMMNII
jgi:hypothetical protein